MQAEYKVTLSPKTEAAAGELAGGLLHEARTKLGFVPNMYGVMANAPGLLDTYIHGYNRFRELSGFTPAEQEVVLLAISRENGCTYCVAAHSFIADKMSGVAVEVTNAIRDGKPIPDARLAALHDFTRTMVVKRGLPSKTDVNAFLAAGYSEQLILEIVLAIAVKTLSNYANHLFHTPVDDAFAGRVWTD
ncbi:carboxymuconolactone decarboxylase family protein [Thiobacillus sp.]|uniref:carboxymuconolactone decarboxylase family protein n=1 Tax=Thiobacillus sp. TaxID=924 RepID=UPI0011D7F145|nr:carboxymuconolactone decarboxylase family protein [Thiobacillus sp.]TXH73969.1 MAG: carboxymuconolactone decarboxylase family protein [Thiobacillus sp.]